MGSDGCFLAGSGHHRIKHEGLQGIACVKRIARSLANYAALGRFFAEKLILLKVSSL